jgi:hypothetical protein
MRNGEVPCNSRPLAITLLAARHASASAGLPRRAFNKVIYSFTSREADSELVANIVMRPSAEFELLAILDLRRPGEQQPLLSVGDEEQQRQREGKRRAYCKRHQQKFWSLPQPLADQPVERLTRSTRSALEASRAVPVAD